MVRWLVANVPQRVEVELKRNPDAAGTSVELCIDVRNPEFAPLDNAHVSVHVTTPDGHTQDLTAEPAATQAGIYTATVLPPMPGAYRARVVATAEDGSQVGERETGWVTEPATEEFRVLSANLALLERLAQRTGGEIVSADQLDQFADSLSGRKVPMVEPWVYPLWHQWSVFAFAVCCLIGEWGLRRWQGLP